MITIFYEKSTLHFGLLPRTSDPKSNRRKGSTVGHD